MHVVDGWMREGGERGGGREIICVGAFDKACKFFAEFLLFFIDHSS